MNSKAILVVDDDPAAARYMILALQEAFQPVTLASDAIQALLAMERDVPALVVSDLRMPDLDGLELLTLIKERWPEVPVILVTVEQDIATVVEAVKRGAANYLVKPVSPASLCTAAEKALAATTRAQGTTDRSVTEIVGVSPAILGVRHLVALAARSDVNVLITGETGTGKELVARAIHRLSSLAHGAFVAHNCAATPSDLFESEFFGHHRGAFTGADRDKVGLLEEAHGGVLFMDELECLTLSHQAKLLRVLDDGEVRPVGSREARPVSVRFLSATNCDPERMLAERALREDLYYRLRGFEIRLSPLRQRPQDIAPLAAHFLESRGVSLTPEALEALEEFTWPGNVRQLRNVLQCAAIRTTKGLIKRRDLTLGREDAGSSVHAGTGGKAGIQSGAVESLSLKDLERQAILQALRESQGNRGRTARALGIHRSTLRRKMRELGIAPRN